MEYLISEPVNFSVSTSDPDFLKSGLFISASPKSPVSRLLQYIHWCLHVRDIEKLQPPSKYCLKHLNKILDLKTLCMDIKKGSCGVIRLQLEEQVDTNVNDINLNYDVEHEFLNTNIQFQLNTFSLEKFFSVVKYNIPLNMPVFDLRTLACDILNEYEENDLKNLCCIKKHSSEDIIAFQLAGKPHPVYLSSENIKEYGNLTLKDLIGFDFAPGNLSYCSIMFKSKHVQNKEGITIEFVSDSRLLTKTMKVTTQTTVNNVKEFICSVYGHPLRLSPANVRLIYNGQPLHDKDFSGSPKKILEYVSGANHTKFHVKINQEFTDSGPDFWPELFNISDIFTFDPQNKNTRTIESTQNAERLRFKERAGSGTNRFHDPNIISKNGRPKNGNCITTSSTQEVEPNYFTESGEPLNRTGEIFEKVLVGGSSFFIAKQEFEENINELSVDGHTIHLHSEDFRLLADQILLKPHVVRKIESVLNTTLEKKEFVTSHSSSFYNRRLELLTPITGGGTNLNNRITLIGNAEWLVSISKYAKLILHSAYLILSNSGLLALLLYIVSAGVVSTKTHALILVMMFTISLFRSIGVVAELWINFFFGAEYPMNDQELQQVRRLIEGPLSPKFLSKFHRTSDSKMIEEALIAKLNSSPELKTSLCATYEINSNLSPHSIVNRVLQRCVLPAYQDKNHHYLHSLFGGILANVDRNLTNLDELCTSELALRKKLRILAYNNSFNNDMRAKLAVFNYVNNLCDFCNDSVMRHTVPDPTKDSVAISILKNATLFVLLFFPFFQSKFEDIITERLSTQQNEPEASTNETPLIEQHETDINDILHDSEDQYNPDSESDTNLHSSRIGTTGFQLNHLDTELH